MPILRVISRNPLLYSFLPYLELEDILPRSSDTVKNADLSDVKKTGADRLKQMFSVDDNEDISPELTSILQVACMSTFIGALYGGVLSSRTAYMDFISNNQATIFRDHLEAKKRLQDKVTLSFGKGAFRWGWRLSFFSTTYMTLSTSISVYRGKFGILEHTIAGATSGLLYKFFAGPRAWIIGCGLGAALGTFAGCISYGLLTLTGTSWEEIRYWQYNWKESRSALIKKSIEKQNEKDELLIQHDEKMKALGKTLSDIDVDADDKKASVAK